jgi:hypothetical protein
MYLKILKILKTRSFVFTAIAAAFIVSGFFVYNLVWAATHEEEVAVAVADRLIDLQNENGSWDWIVTNQAGPTTATYYNISGVTAEGLLGAYALSNDSKYLEAAEKTGAYIIDTPISTTTRQNAFNIVFLQHLSQMTGDEQYWNKASEIFNHLLNEENYFSFNLGNHCGEGCTPADLVAAYKNYRGAETNPSGVVAWDLAPFVISAHLFEETDFENEMASEIDAYLSQGAYAETVKSYELGLSAGISALSMAGMDYSEYLTKLLAKQDAEEGFFSSPEFPKERVQSTAYALMALTAAGESESADRAASYLIHNFGYHHEDVLLHGWLEDDTEYSEINSEAAQALTGYVFMSQNGGEEPPVAEETPLVETAV